MSAQPSRKKEELGGYGKQTDTRNGIVPVIVPARDVEEHNKNPKAGGMEFNFNFSTEHIKPNADVFGNLNQPPGWESVPISKEGQNDDEEEIPNVPGIEPEIMEQYRMAIKKQKRYVKKMLVTDPGWKGPNGGYYGYHVLRYVQPEDGNLIATFATYQAIRANRNDAGQVGAQQNPTPATTQKAQFSDHGTPATATTQSVQVKSTSAGEVGSYSSPKTAENQPAQASGYGIPAAGSFQPAQPSVSHYGQMESYSVPATGTAAATPPSKYDGNCHGQFALHNPHRPPWVAGNPLKYHGSHPELEEHPSSPASADQMAPYNDPTNPGRYQSPYADIAGDASPFAPAPKEPTSDDPYGQRLDMTPVPIQPICPYPNQLGSYSTIATVNQPAQHNGSYHRELGSHLTSATGTATEPFMPPQNGTSPDQLGVSATAATSQRSAGVVRYHDGTINNATGQSMHMRIPAGGLELKLQEPTVSLPWMKDGKYINARDLKIRIGLDRNSFEYMPLHNCLETPGYLAFRKTREDGTIVRKDWLPGVDNVMFRNLAGEFLDEQGVPYPYDDQRDSKFLQIIPKHR